MFTVNTGVVGHCRSTMDVIMFTEMFHGPLSIVQFIATTREQAFGRCPKCAIVSAKSAPETKKIFSPGW
jgi:hypothetical protein